MPEPTPSASAGNQEQIRHWNEVAGPQWVERQDILDRMIGSFGAKALDGARFAAGESVLDVGCGTGQTTVEIARRVAPGGRVVGLDVSRPMLEAARRRPTPAGAVAIDFREGDAQVAPIERAAYDVVFSRFGVMFFADPVAAFRNLHGALRSSGRLAVLCWQGLARNPWVAGPVQALAAVLPMPAPPPPGAPGPFSMGDPDRVKEILGGAGFRDVALAEIEDDLAIGDGRVEPTVEFLLKIGPCATLLKDAPPQTVEKARSTLRAFFDGTARDGKVTQHGATWLVTARPS
ncbi:MAG TPA: class I SAM-dependent methyltransferase [Thermoanaerobaculia bacterium]|nr:class I SAM-dependent methyltransferase [Thermoanaerobaculia bacterium]